MTLDIATKEDYAWVKRLYKSAFPKEERAPFYMLKRRAIQGRGELLIARKDEKLIGFAYLLTYRDLVYLFYFAIHEEVRGSGYGSRILQTLKDRYAGKRFFLAREQLDKSADNYDQRVQRHGFYLKNGLSDLPIRLKEGNVVYDVMGVNGNVTAKEYDELITSWSGRLIKKLVDMRIIEDDTNKKG